MKKRVGISLIAVTMVLLLFCGVFTSSRAVQTEKTVALPILMYHHIHKSSDHWGEHVISPQTFEGDLQYLNSQGYTTITTTDLLAYVDKEKDLPEKPVMITFDDGQLSFMEYALPLLKKYDMKAVMTIVGAYADQYTETTDRNVSYAYMNWKDLKKLSQTGCVEVENHTYNLHSLNQGRQGCRINSGEDPGAYQRMFAEDVQKNGSLIQEATGKAPIAFAYPYGFFCNEARETLVQQGYQILFTCDGRVNHLTGDPKELLQLCRFNRSNNVSRAQFFAQFR